MVWRGSAAGVVVHEWMLRCLGLALVLGASWFCAVLLTTATLDARIVNSRTTPSGEAFELTLAYRTPSGTEATFRQVVPKSTALPLLGVGHVPIAYRAGPKNAAVVEIGSRTTLLRTNLFLAMIGVLLILAPTVGRRIRVWGAKMRGDPPPTPRRPVRPRELATMIALVITFAATFVAFPALVRHAEVTFVACAIILAIVRRHRAG